MENKKWYGEKVEIILHFNSHVIKIVQNVPSVAKFKKSIDYLQFENRYGDVLFDNKEFKPRLFEEKVFQCEGHIYLNFETLEKGSNVFNEILTSILWMIDAKTRCLNQILDTIIDGFEKIDEDKKRIFANITVMADLQASNQDIVFEYLELKQKVCQVYKFSSKI